MFSRIRLVLVCLFAALSASPDAARAADRPLRLLFLGDNAGHRPADRFRDLQPVLAGRGIELVYTDRVADLNAERLGDFDGLVIFANHTEIAPEQEQALLDFVAQGKGFVPLHCASYCFLNSPKYIELVGAQFQSHQAGVFRVQQAAVEHPILKDFGSFESWDETYKHTKHNERDRIVLEYRTSEGRGYSGRRLAQPEADDPTTGEPWTWVRTHGAGRVFYTAWGHDERTWTNAGFQNLVERGIRWACGDDPAKAGPYRDRPEMTVPDDSPVDTIAANLPFYPAGERWGTIGEPITRVQAPLDPEESMKRMSTPVGFRPELIATEPEIGKPIALNWDERGRLWIAETLDYPNEMQPEGQGRDRIRICEDTDGDGRADKFTIFAEKLSIPTSLTFAYGGVIVHQAPHTLFLRDTTGDDVADQRHVLFTGWNTNDTHAGPSNLNYGLDGWYYGMTGYAGFNGQIAGERQRFQTGFYRFRLDPPATDADPPTVAEFEFLRNTNNNSWGVGISEDGILFGSTANGNPSEYMPIANRYYERVRGWSSSVLGGIALDNWMHPIVEEVRQVDWHGGFTAGSGHALYTARAYPREYWNRTAFVTEPTGHVVATFTIQPAGAGFRSRNSWNLVASVDEWTAPIAAEVGPDGHVWIIDWYNIVVQHNPTPVGYDTGKGNAYESEYRDKRHGRIYRIRHEHADDVLSGFDASRTGGLDLSQASTDELVAALRHTNFFWRRHAQRMLIERGDAAAIPALRELVNTQADSGEEFAPAAAHALWTLQGLDGRGAEAATVALAEGLGLDHASAGVRRNAVLVLPDTAESLARIAELGLTSDADPQVRLAALLKVADMPSHPRGAELAIAALSDPSVTSDRWLLDAATSAAAAHGVPLLEQLADAQWSLRPVAFDVLTIVGEHLGRGGEAETLTKSIPVLSRLEPRTAAAVLQGLANGWPRDRTAKLAAEAEDSLIELFEKSEAGSKTLLLTLASRIGSSRLDAYATELTDAMLAKIRDEALRDADRIAAARQLIDFRKTDGATAIALLEEIGPRTAPELAQGFLEAAASSSAPETFADLAERLSTFTPALRNSAIRAMIASVDGANAFLKAVEDGHAQLGDLALDQKQALAAHPDRRLARRARTLLEQGGGLPNPDRQRVIDEYHSITEVVGNAAAGKEAFKKQCSKCHTHSGEGTKIGPDLTGMAIHPKHELLVHILDPSRSVEGNFRAYTVATVEGLVLTGLLASETRTSIELFDAEGKKQTLQRDDIEQIVASQKSLMPEGFEKQMTREELTDLLEFMTQRGQYVPLSIEKVATAVSTRSMFVNENADAERLIFPDWAPKTVDGVPFQLIDPQGTRVANAIVLNSPSGPIAARMPRSVRVLCNSSAKAIHLLSGVAGWAHPYGEDGQVSMIVRLHYADGQTEDHELKNGEHFADYIRRVDVPGSKFAFRLRGQQIRYLAVTPQRPDVIREIEFLKGPDQTAPVVMAVTVESR
ncbi:MAG: ThuA domain-containing protein [Planctomyces sp.]|nr:ThuA domain-containing protein [Planctomyces sp.]